MTDVDEYLNRQLHDLRLKIKEAITSEVGVGEDVADSILEEIDDPLKAKLWQVSWGRESFGWFREKYDGDFEREQYDVTDAPDRTGAEVLIAVMSDYRGRWSIDWDDDRLIMSRGDEEG